MNTFINSTPPAACDMRVDLFGTPIYSLLPHYTAALGALTPLISSGEAAQAARVAMRIVRAMCRYFAHLPSRARHEAEQFATLLVREGRHAERRSRRGVAVPGVIERTVTPLVLPRIQDLYQHAQWAAARAFARMISVEERSESGNDNEQRKRAAAAAGVTLRAQLFASAVELDMVPRLRAALKQQRRASQRRAWLLASGQSAENIDLKDDVLDDGDDDAATADDDDDQPLVYTDEEERFLIDMTACNTNDAACLLFQQVQLAAAPPHLRRRAAAAHKAATSGETPRIDLLDRIERAVVAALLKHLALTPIALATARDLSTAAADAPAPDFSRLVDVWRHAARFKLWAMQQCQVLAANGDSDDDEASAAKLDDHAPANTKKVQVSIASCCCCKQRSQHFFLITGFC